MNLIIDQAEYSENVYKRYEKLVLLDKLRASGCTESLALEAIGISRATFYRWRKNYRRHSLKGLENLSTVPNKRRETQWTLSLEQKVLNIRRQNPLYGKNKIRVILKRDWKTNTSVSTVGRILTDLIKRKLIQKAPFYYANRSRKSRIFSGHAQRWKRHMKAKNPGE